MAKTEEIFSTATSAEDVRKSASITEGHERANTNPSKERSFFAWFDRNDGPIERRLILKLDFLTLSFACMGFWVCLGLLTSNRVRVLTYISGNVHR